MTEEVNETEDKVTPLPETLVTQAPEDQKDAPTPTKSKTLHWEPTDEIKITGLQFDVFQKFVSLFESLVVVKNDIWKAMLTQGIVKDEEGNSVTAKDLK